jgi:hypothetical protein
MFLSCSYRLALVACMARWYCKVTAWAGWVLSLNLKLTLRLVSTPDL